MSTTPMKNEGRRLLLTMTGEPLQPVRLYYSIPNHAAVTRTLTGLHCIAKTETGAWHWHYDKEANVITFARPRQDIPKEVHPIILGCIRLPSKDKMVLAVRSYERAIEAAKFFAPLFGERVLLRRARVLNRMLDASENAGGFDRIDELLDQGVMKIDAPNATDESDVPLVEDFPLHPEEETSDFQHLAMTLRFRSLRAYEHWKGNTRLTLADVIRRILEDGGRGLSVVSAR